MTQFVTSPRRPGASAGACTIHVVQGEFFVSDDADVTLSTVLGSCVAACMRDPAAGIGGMNHFLLPGNAGGGDSMKYGINSMELLINEAKLFGGANVVHNLSDIGAQNAAFAQKFLAMEGISFLGGSLGGQTARRLRYWPVSGRASQMLLDDATGAVFRSERAKPLPAPVPAGGIELF